MMPDGTLGELDVDPLTHMESEYGIFVSDAAKDMERKQKIEGLAQAAVQNGMPMSAVAAIFESDNFSQIKDKIIQAEKAAEQLKQAQDQAMQQQKQQELELKDKEIQQAALDKEKDRQVQIEVALINAENAENANNVSLQKLMQDFQAKQDEIAFKEKQLEAKSAETMAKLNNEQQ